MKPSSINQYLILILSVLFMSVAFAESHNTPSEWCWHLPTNNHSVIVAPSASDEMSYSVPENNTYVPTIHIIPSEGELFEETLQFNGEMIVSSDSEDVTLLQEYDDNLKITTVKIRTSSPTTLYCHGSGRLIGRKAPLYNQLSTQEPPESPGCDGDKIVLKNNKYHWLVVKHPKNTKSSFSKHLIDDLLESAPGKKLSFLPELGTDIIAYPEAHAGGSGDGGNGYDPWNIYGRKINDPDACPKCGRAPCPRCNVPHCTRWHLETALIESGVPQERAELISIFILLYYFQFVAGDGYQGSSAP